MRISVLGSGRWGSFLAWYLNRIGHRVTIWGREESAAFAELRSSRKNEYVTLPNEIEFTCDLEHAQKNSDCLIISVSGQGLRQLVTGLRGYKKPVVLCMKGIEADTGLRLSEIASEALPRENIAVWVGPGHIQCFTANIPNCMLLDGYDQELQCRLIDVFKSSLIKFYRGADIIGSEIGAAAKNVIGIAAGMLDGGNLTTLKGALMARGAREVSRLISAMGGNELSAYGLCHLGDYETTLFSPYSNNRAFGEAFVKNEPYRKLAEGVKTCDGMMYLARKHGVELPITSAVQRILNREGEPMKLLTELFERENQIEFN